MEIVPILSLLHLLKSIIIIFMIYSMMIFLISKILYNKTKGNQVFVVLEHHNRNNYVKIIVADHISKMLKKLKYVQVKKLLIYLIWV
jgi:hypothetical protein